MQDYDNQLYVCGPILIRGTLAEEIIQAKEAYGCLLATHGTRVYTYRENNRIFSYPLFKKTVQTCVQKKIYCGVVYHHQNTIVELRTNELTLGRRTLILHTNRLCPEAVSITLCNLSPKVACQRHNILDMDEYRKTLEQKLVGVELQICPMDYHI